MPPRPPSWGGTRGPPRSIRSRRRLVSSSSRRDAFMSGRLPVAGDAGELMWWREVDAVGSVEEPEPPPRFAGAPVLPDDAVAARVDDDHAVISIVVGKDIT